MHSMRIIAPAIIKNRLKMAWQRMLAWFAQYGVK